MNVTYIYTKDKYVKGKPLGHWVAIGHFCRTCNKMVLEKKIKLSQGMTTTENLRKGERKRA